MGKKKEIYSFSTAYGMEELIDAIYTDVGWKILS